MSRETILAATLVQMADTLVADFDVVELLSVLVDRCVVLLDLEAAELMLVTQEGGLQLMASKGVRGLEPVELNWQQAPDLDRTGLDRPVHVLPMRLRGAVIGALSLIGRESEEMSQIDLAAAQALADIATIAILKHRASLEAQVVNEHLRRAINSRIVIEQAKGMIAEREGVNMDQAFVRLRNHARNHNLRLRDLARDVSSGILAASRLDRLPAANS
jgi:ANTAR domain-containing protein